MIKRCCLYLFLALVSSCVDNEALRGRISLTLTDAPTDASIIREVNVAISGIEVLPKGSQKWQTIKSFDEPLTLNLLEFTQGKFYDLTEQYLTPGEYEGLRLELNIANVANGLTVFPQSNLVFTNGSQETLFVVNGGTNYVEIKSNFEVSTNQTTFLTIDFDVRKSVIHTAQGYRLRPVIRLVGMNTAGGINGLFRDFANFNKVVVFAYSAGSYQTSESLGDEPFSNAITSTSVRNSVSGQFYLAYLPEGTYELVYVFLNADGSVKELLGIQKNIIVGRGEDTNIAILTSDLE